MTLLEQLRNAPSDVCIDAAETIESMEREIEDLRNKLEYAYRCVNDGFSGGHFDFTALRTLARDYVEEIENKFAS